MVFQKRACPPPPTSRVYIHDGIVFIPTLPFNIEDQFISNLYIEGVVPIPTLPPLLITNISVNHTCVPAAPLLAFINFIHPSEARSIIEEGQDFNIRVSPAE